MTEYYYTTIQFLREKVSFLFLYITVFSFWDDIWEEIRGPKALTLT